MYRILTTGLTIIGVEFSIELLEWGRTFSDVRANTANAPEFCTLGDK